MKRCCKCRKQKDLSEFYQINHKPYARCKECDRKRKQTERKLRSHSHIDRKHMLKKRYGMTPEDYVNLFNTQKGCCAICYVHQDKLSYHLAVDHNHGSDKVRGLLCKRCNSALGLFNDNVEFLMRAIEYVKLR